MRTALMEVENLATRRVEPWMHRKLQWISQRGEKRMVALIVLSQLRIGSSRMHPSVCVLSSSSRSEVGFGHVFADLRAFLKPEFQSQL